MVGTEEWTGGLSAKWGKPSRAEYGDARLRAQQRRTRLVSRRIARAHDISNRERSRAVPRRGNRRNGRGHRLRDGQRNRVCSLPRRTVALCRQSRCRETGGGHGASGGLRGVPIRTLRLAKKHGRQWQEVLCINLVAAEGSTVPDGATKGHENANNS